MVCSSPYMVIRDQLIPYGARADLGAHTGVKTPNGYQSI